ncbi:hypothetical protein M5689_015521 [Euphorbia peplus]|nr:hypothetical protein M5689_015521 [Euphorbia peplus]
MASSQNKEDGQGQQSPAPATGYPATMGYPPGYYNPGGPPPPLQLEDQQARIKKVSGIFRGLVAGIIFFFLFLCIISIITWLILHPVVPIFHLNSFNVSDFKISPSPNFLTANFVANITAINPNEKLVIEFYDVDAFIIYNGEYLLGASMGEPFNLKIKENYTMELKTSAGNNISDDSDEFKSNEMRKIATDRSSSGKVRFELRIFFWGTFKSGHWWERNAMIKVFCEDLDIAFLNNNSTNGTLANANLPLNCLANA